MRILRNYKHLSLHGDRMLVIQKCTLISRRVIGQGVRRRSRFTRTCPMYMHNYNKLMIVHRSVIFHNYSNVLCLTSIDGN